MAHAGAAMPEGAGRPRGFRAFAGGLHNHHPLVLLAAAALLYPGLLGFQAVVTSGEYTIVPESAVLRIPKDDFMHVSYQVAYLKRHPPKVPAVYLVGGSSTRECIESGPRLARAIERSDGGAPVAAYDLGSQNQNLGQSMAIIENLPPGPGQAIVVIGISGNRFTPTPRENELQTQGRDLLLDAPALRAFAARDPAKGPSRALMPGILPGIMNYLMGYLKEHRQALLDGRLPHTTYIFHKYTKAHIWSLRGKKAKVDFWIKKNGADFARNVDYNGRLLDLMVKTARQRGFTVVLLELPENTRAVGTAFDPFKRVYMPLVKRIAAKNGATYLQPQATGAVQLVNVDFRDITHLVEPGRTKWQTWLAARLAPLVVAAR